MATFEAQVEGLTSLSIDGSSAPTQTELTQFLTDGAKEILNSLPKSKKMLYSTATSLNGSSTNLTIGGSEIFNVTRDDGTINQPCRKISPELSGRASDSGDMIAATTTDPVYYIQNNILSVIPEPTNSNNAQVQTLAYPAVAYGDSSITRFPDEAEYLVPLYASVKSLQNLLGSRSSNSDITTALTAINTELDETQAVCDKIDADLVLAKAEVVLAKTEAAEMATQTDNSGNFETACDAMATELNKVDEIISLANEEFDEVATQTSGSKDSPITDAFTQFELVAAQLTLGETDSEGDVNTAMALLKAAVDQAETAADKFESADESIFGDEETFLTSNSQLTRVKNALDEAEDIINSNEPSATTDAYGAQAAEDVELVASALNIAQTEIRRAQAHIQEWVAIGDMRVKEVNVALSEADGYAKEIQTRLQQASAKREEAKSRISAGSAYLQEAQGIIQAGNAYLQEAQARISQAQGYAAEINARGSFTSAKSKAVQGYISTAQAYVATARGFGDEIQAKVQIAQGYGSEIQLRLSVDSAQYAWYEKQQTKLQLDYEKGLQAIR
jgi:chromosome segregation ATPase